MNVYSVTDKEDGHDFVAAESEESAKAFIESRGYVVASCKLLSQEELDGMQLFRTKDDENCDDCIKNGCFDCDNFDRLTGSECLKRMLAENEEFPCIFVE